MDERLIRLGDVGFPYYFGSDCLDRIGHYLSTLNADRLVVITDDTVSGLYSDALLAAIHPRLPVTVLSAAPGESMKSLGCVSNHIEGALSAGVSRRSVVVSLGGGVPGNLAGVVASLLFRGIRLVHIPTTTISAMDSVLSLKQAVNSKVGKNHVGCYYRPEAVLVDVALFRSLPDRELRSGLCEMAKNCLAIDPPALPGLWSALRAGDLSDPGVLLWLLEASIKAKSEVTAADSRERSAGLVLEYGHTVGHAVELVDHRRRGSDGLSHGDCVAIGMLIAARISAARGWLTEDELATHDRLVAALGVPTEVLASLSVAEIMSVVADDNKRGYLPEIAGDEVPFVLLKTLGAPASSGDLPLVSVTLTEISTALEDLVRELGDVSADSAVGAML